MTLKAVGRQESEAYEESTPLKAVCSSCPRQVRLDAEGPRPCRAGYQRNGCEVHPAVVSLNHGAAEVRNFMALSPGGFNSVRPPGRALPTGEGLARAVGTRRRGGWNGRLGQPHDTKPGRGAENPTMSRDTCRRCRETSQ